jgi:chromosome segregation ATPase
MKLFNPSNLKAKLSRNKSADVQKLSEQIAMKTKELNSIESSFEADKTKIQDSFDAFFKGVEAKKLSLLNEVSELEQRREVALKPLEEREQAVTSKEAELITKEADLVIRETMVKEMTDKMSDAEFSFHEYMADKKEELIEREEDIFKQEQNLKSEKERSAESLKKLQDDWAKFHIEVANEKEWIGQRKNEIQSERIVLENMRKNNEESQKQIEQDRRAIKDGYDNLEKARKEILSI